MSRHFWRACNREGAFTFVELLVTIIIAGIAFAAIVPVFVQGMAVGSGDKMRMVAFNVAQDRVEKIRQLDFELITSANLANNAFYFGEFGSSWTEQTESGSKQFDLTYSVEDKPVSATDTRIAYKLVTVTADWNGAPSPHKAVQLKTAIYRQYTGPEIVAFGVAATDLQGADPSSDIIVSQVVHLTATINSADLDSMRPRVIGVAPNQRTLRGRVDFLVTSSTGITYPTVKVDYDENSVTPAQFPTTWTVPGSAGAYDGYYSFKAIAFTASGAPGNSWEFSTRIETGPPSPVSSLSATSGATSASLLWSPSLSGDLDHYEVFRTPLNAAQQPTGPAVLLDDDVAITDVGYSDEGPLTQDAWYRYSVYSVDWDANRSAEASCDVQAVDAGVSSPLPAANLKGEIINSSARLSWTMSPSPGVLGYHVYVNGLATSSYTVTAATIDVPQGWGTTAWYQVKPYIVGDLVASMWSSLIAGSQSQDVAGVLWVKVVVPAEQLYTLNINNSTNKTLTSLRLYFLGAAGADQAQEVLPAATNRAVGSITTWTDLAAGKYRWAWVKSNNQSGVKEGWLTGPTYTVNEGTPNP